MQPRRALPVEAPLRVTARPGTPESMDCLTHLARRAAAVSLLALATAPGTSAADPDLPAKGQFEVKTIPVSGSSPKIVVRAVVDQPPQKIWKILSDCDHYKDHLPNVAASKLIKMVGNIQTCEVTVSMPFPLANLTGVTEAVIEENDKGMSRRWKLVRGDYKYNDGSWEVKPADKAGATSLIVYTVHAEPNTIIPDWLRERVQKKLLPEMVERVRAEAAKLP